MAILIVLLVIIWLGGQASATANLKRESREHFQKSENNYIQSQRREAGEKDYYFDPVLKRNDYCFYSDGSLRYDRYTSKQYPKGMYFCDSFGRGIRLNMMPPDIPRPPK